MSDKSSFQLTITWVNIKVDESTRNDIVWDGLHDGGTFILIIWVVVGRIRHPIAGVNVKASLSEAVSTRGI